MEVSQLLLPLVTLTLGLRHGFDWDHIAAISNINALEKNKKASFIYGMSYILGHSLTVITLGLLAVFFGIKLPAWIDSIMGPFVGITLIALGTWLLLSIFREKNAKPMSRGNLVLKILRYVRGFFGKKAERAHVSKEEGKIGIKGALSLGVIHGIGAETPTQLLLFVTAAGLSGVTFGILIILSFVVGLTITNTLVVLFSIFGLNIIKKNPKVYVALGTLSALFSIGVGVIFLLGDTPFSVLEVGQ